jgi:hypothetical protein
MDHRVKPGGDDAIGVNARSESTKQSAAACVARWIASLRS